MSVHLVLEISSADMQRIIYPITVRVDLPSIFSNLWRREEEGGRKLVYCIRCVRLGCGCSRHVHELGPGALDIVLVAHVVAHEPESIGDVARSNTRAELHTYIYIHTYILAVRAPAIKGLHGWIGEERES